MDGIYNLSQTFDEGGTIMTIIKRMIVLVSVLAFLGTGILGCGQDEPDTQRETIGEPDERQPPFEPYDEEQPVDPYEERQPQPVDPYDDREPVDPYEERQPQPVDPYDERTEERFDEQTGERLD